MNDPAVAIPELDGVSHRFVELPGARIHVAEAGAGPPVVLLHGWPQHWYAWRKVIPLLGAHHRLICPDLRGFGWSDAPPGLYAKRELAADVIALMDALELERADLIAHDWGAWIGFMLCLDHPDRFGHYLALNMYTPWPPPPSPRGLLVLARLWYQLLISAPLLGETLIRRTDFVGRLITAGAVGRPWTKAELAAFTEVLREEPRARASVALYRTFLTRELLPFLRDRNAGRELEVPTLLLHGTRDLAIDHHSLGEWRGHARAMEVELRPDSGHFIAEELPEVVARRATDLFSGALLPQTL